MQKSVQVGVGVLIYNEHREILLGQRINSHGEKSYGPPGGHLEFGETFESCAIREVKEETNLVVVSPKFVCSTNDIFSNKDKHYISIFMKADYPTGQFIINMEPHKILKWEWYNLDNLPNNLFLPLQQLINLTE
jgi:8-oxo-dGTP diphosphatase